MQKVVSIHFKAWDETHGKVEEHLSNYLEAGWRVKQLTAAGGSGDAAVACCVYAIVVLEKNE